MCEYSSIVMSQFFITQRLEATGAATAAAAAAATAATAAACAMCATGQSNVTNEKTDATLRVVLKSLEWHQKNVRCSREM